LFERHCAAALEDHPHLQGRRLLYESIRRMLSALVYDVIDTTRGGLEEQRPADVDAVRSIRPLVAFSPATREAATELKRFLLNSLYRHPQVMATTEQAKQVVRELFDAYRSAPAQMPAGYARRDDTPRAVADYIAGMTDRFALRDHERLTGRKLLAVG
jgi:dGTPase